MGNSISLGLGLAMIGMPIIFAGEFLAAAFGFDAVTVTALMIACTVGSSILQKALMSRAARVVWGVTDWPFGLQCAAVLALALLFYLLFGRGLYVPYKSDYGSLIRYLGMVVLAWPVIVLLHIALDREEGIYDAAHAAIVKGMNEAATEFDSQSSAAAAPPQLVGGEVTFNPAGQAAQEVGRFGNVSIQQAPPKDEGVFAFDPAKFKR